MVDHPWFRVLYLIGSSKNMNTVANEIYYLFVPDKGWNLFYSYILDEIFMSIGWAGFMYCSHFSLSTKKVQPLQKVGGGIGQRYRVELLWLLPLKMTY